jgi:hypothetical protein
LVPVFDVSDTTVSRGLSVIDLSSLHCAVAAALPQLCWRLYTPAFFLSREVPYFIGRCDHHVEIIANEMI